MIARMAFAAFMAALAGSAIAATDIQFDPASKSRTYRKLLIEPVQVQFHRDFVDQTSAIRGPSRRYTRAEMDEIAREMGDQYRTALAEAFRSRGFEIAAAPAADVLRIKPALKDLNVNIPKGTKSGEMQLLARDVGSARMIVEGNDASGSRVLLASKDATAGDTAGFHASGEVSKRAFFDGMFRDWADEVAVALTSRN